jgi:hypothetical protein
MLGREHRRSLERTIRRLRRVVAIVLARVAAGHVSGGERRHITVVGRVHRRKRGHMAGCISRLVFEG